MKCLVFILALITTFGCSSQAATPTVAVTPTQETAQAAASTSIVIGDISNDPSDTIESFQPLADHLAAQLGEFGIDSGEVKVAPDMETMIEWIKAGEVDLYFDSPYPALIISNETGAKPILRRWKEGIGEYHTVIFALEGGDITSVEDLTGKRLAFDEPFSTSGYMLPYAYLVEAGLQGVEAADAEAEIADDKVNYIFTHDDETTIQWVLNGRVDAGVTDSGVYYNDIPEDTREGLVIVAETEPLPRHVTIAAPDIEGDMLAAITSALLTMDETDEGKAVLETFEETAQFDEFPGGIDTALSRMRELYEMVQTEDQE